MNEDQTMFAEMLGIKRSEPERVTRAVRASAVASAQTEDSVSELDVQKEVVQEMAHEKAVLEERQSMLEAEKQEIADSARNLEAENRRLAEENAALEREKASLEERLAARERDLADQKEYVEETRKLNAVLEEKLARMARTVLAVRRAAAEATKVEIGGRRW